MPLSIGDRLPAAAFIEMTEGGPAEVALGDLLAGQKVVLFAVPGAYTGVCSTQHVPSFIRTAEGFAAKGVNAILCVAVNDPYVLRAWGEATGAGKAGIRMLADAEGAFTRAIGMAFDRPEGGLFGRSKRYALLAEDGVVRVLNVEASTRDCEISAGETLLAAV